MTNIATRLPTDMAGWAPVTRHYQVDDGYLAVTVLDFLGNRGTYVLYADQSGGAISSQPLVEFVEGTSFDQALQNLGYTVVDEIGDEVARSAPRKKRPKPEPTVFDMIPPALADRVKGAVNTAAPSHRWIRSPK